MGSNKKTITIDYNNGTPIFNPTPGATQLDKGDWVTLQLSRFPNADNTITALDFYNNKVENGEDKKDSSSPAGGWTSRNGASNLTAYTVGTSSSSTDVTITDNEDTAQDDKHWFSVTIGGTGAPSGGWSLDPELINKKRP